MCLWPQALRFRCFYFTSCLLLNIAARTCSQMRFSSRFSSGVFLVSQWSDYVYQASVLKRCVSNCLRILCFLYLVFDLVVAQIVLKQSYQTIDQTCPQVNLEHVSRTCCFSSCFRIVVFSMVVAHLIVVCHLVVSQYVFPQAVFRNMMFSNVFSISFLIWALAILLLILFIKLVSQTGVSKSVLELLLWNLFYHLV